MSFFTIFSILIIILNVLRWRFKQTDVIKNNELNIFIVNIFYIITFILHYMGVL